MTDTRTQRQRPGTPQQLGRRLARASFEPAHANRYSVQVRPTFVRLPRRTDGAHP
jgi:hypothetical protein